MSAPDKPIVISRHAQQRMTQRGAERAEVEHVVRNGNGRNAEHGRLHARIDFPFDDVSPVNNRHYAFKAVDVVFADNPDEIVIITVKVFYYD